MKKATRTAIEEKLKRLWFNARTWGALERLAGVADRDAFWQGKTEAEAREALRQLVRGRIERGEI